MNICNACKFDKNCRYQASLFQIEPCWKKEEKVKSICFNCRFDLGNCAYEDQDEFVKICLHKIDKET